MSSPAPVAADPQPKVAPPPEDPLASVRSAVGRWSAVAVLFIVALLAVLTLLFRLSLMTDSGRAGMMAALNGLELGPVGRLHVEGLRGDPLDVFSLDRLTIADPQGVWLDARGLSARWSPLEALVRRRLHVRALAAQDVVVLRRPILKERGPRAATRPPFSLAIDRLALRLEARPAFSGAAGDWDVQGALDYARSGAATTRLDASSRLHAGDGLHFDARFGRKGELQATARAQEAAGGAIAGALGLPTGQVFALNAVAAGDGRSGRFELHSRSGAMSPADARGDWSPTGGGMSGRVALAASRILAPYAAKIGPEARFVVHAAVPDRRGLQAVEARLAGQFAHLHASGPANLAQRTTPGMALEVQVADLVRWNHLATVGPTRMVGTLKGQPDRFTYAGRIAGDRFRVNSEYEVGHLEGPAAIAVDRKGLRFTGDLAGVRGAGKGLMLTLLGSAPRAQADVTYPPDHRLAVHSLHVAGANLRIDADGGQTLLGGFALKGQASVASLTGWRPGSGGGFDGAWTASIPKDSHRWTLSFDAKGRALKTGLAEADRLMGATPRLTGAGTFEDGNLVLPRTEFTGAMAAASGSAGIGPKGEITADFAWSAKGPFAAGPVEVAGDPRGRGRFTGTFTRPEADLSADLASLDLGRLVIRPAHLTLAFVGGASGMEGKASIAGPSDWGIAHANAAFRFTEGGLALNDIAADAGGVQVAGAVTLRDGAPSSADLKVNAKAGAFLSAGRLAGDLRITGKGGGGSTVAAQLKGSDIALPGSTLSLRSLTLTADGPLERLPLTFSVESPLPTPYRFSGQGVFEGAAAQKTLTLTGAGKLRQAEIRTTEPAVLRFGPAETSARLRLAGAGGRVDIDADRRGDAVTAKAALTGVALGALNDDYEGALTGSLSLQGKGARLEGRMDARLGGARAKDAPAALGLDAQVSAVLSNDRIRLGAEATNSQGLKSRVDLTLPAEAAADPLRIAVVRTKGVSGSFSADGELRSLWDLLVGGDRTLAGHLVTQGKMAGTLNDLKIEGDATLSKGRFQDAPSGLVLQNLEVQARFADNQLDVTRFTGADQGKGVASGDGRISLLREGGSSFQLKLTRFQLVDNSLAKATASGAVTVVRDAQGHAKLSGGLTIDRADITAKPPIPTGVVPMEVREIHRTVKPGEDESAPRRSGPLQIAVDVTLKAPRSVFVRGRGLDAELSLDAHVGGVASKPELTGVARLVRGSYDFSGKRFDFDESGVVRLGSTVETIRLDLLARREDPALTATVRIVGTAAKPQITLSSVPVLPQDEILSRVLFGVSASQLSGFQAAQLASAVAGLASGGGFDILGNLRQFAGLDRLAIGGDASGATVSGGKYVTDNIYIELTGAGQQRTTTTTDPGRTGSSAQVEWRVRKNLSLVSQAWTGGDVRLSVRFRKDY